MEEKDRPQDPIIEATPPAEQFLQHALGTSDVRLPSLLLTLAASVAVIAVLVRRGLGRGSRTDSELDSD